MQKRVVLIFAVIMGITSFPISSLSGATLTAAPPDCPSCASFGVQRFQEKKEAPPFSLKDLEGNPVTLNALKGKPVLMIFFASWCPGCKEEIPLFEKFSIGKKDPLTILTVAIDGEKEKRIKQFVKELKITLPVLLDVKEKVARTYGVRMVPTTFLIDGEGWMQGVIMGQRDWSNPAAWSVIKELLIR